MNEAKYQELVEAGWRRRLTPAEQAHLRAWVSEHPERRMESEAEAGLNRLLDRLPDVPVASNFTARVLQAAERESARSTPRPILADLWHRFFPRPVTGVAWAVVMLALVLIAYQQASFNAARQRATELATFGRAAALSDPKLLADFDAIRRLPQSDDEELFAVLNQ